MTMTRGLALPLSEKNAKNLLYAFYKRQVERRGNIFEFTKETKALISYIGDFLTIETRLYGLFMPGGVGNGKTTMLKALRDLLIYLVDKGLLKYSEGDKYPVFITARDMVTTAVDDRNEFRRIKSARYLFIDDLCSEQAEVVSFGTYVYPFREILEYRYDHMLPTFITSNFSASDIGNKYGSLRVTDRMREMFKIISFKNGSFR